MQNLFDIINGDIKSSKLSSDPLGDTKGVNVNVNVNIETNSNTLPQTVSLSDLDLNDLIVDWQKNNKPEQTQELLKRMQPTINSALHSYAGGMEDQMRIKAAKLTLDALRSYDPNRGTSASTYVFHNLKRLNRYATQSTNIISIPEGLASDTNRVNKAIADFNDRENRDPSDQELADITGLSRKRINQILDSATILSESSTLTTEGQQSTYTQNILTDKDYFEYVYASTDPINQKIMEWSAGMHGKPKLTAVEIAKKLHMSPAAVSLRMAKIQKMMAEVREVL